MRDLSSAAAWASLATPLAAAAEAIVAGDDHVRLLVPSTAAGLLGSAQVEAALLDRGVAYRRRVRAPADLAGAATEADLVIETERIGPGLIHEDGGWHVTSMEVEAFQRPERGEGKRGVLDAAAVAGLLAGRIAPNGPRVRAMRPWLLAGNWWRGALDAHDDPVWSTLRDALRSEGSIRVVPLPEDPHATILGLAGLDRGALADLADEWPRLDLEQRAERLASLTLPVFAGQRGGTARLEALIWQRVVVPGWRAGFAERAAEQRTAFEVASEDPVETGRAVDALLARPA